ncbi:The BTB (BR-C, ttk and bab)/POZ (Pox virus and Zinc finger) domain [Ceratobasidium sp. AG-Ba]|nr:The BTB (BR-C, ttk and bab)/POZ (Pox virus and Zinc finger) domain [Ceratobasidium sp. AG-Ba]QRW07140.1 The BTB (BR-C, ttk and bab)/POZ (Pox virus and Zinc finger) domain [Ceratobasidium sp. AG-Ba]
MTLRSLDGVHFQVHSVVLSIASPILADMFKLSSGKSVVDFAESSDALNFLLNFIYPRVPPPIPSFEVLEKGLHLASKYELEGMKVYLKERLYLKSSAVTVYSNPLRVLALACSHGLSEEAKLAASVARDFYDFRKTDELVKVCREMPPIAPIVKMIGLPSARAAILNNVLFQFHQRPMALTDDAKHFLCSTCQDHYLDRSRYSAPEWQTRWAHWAFKELEYRPIEKCAEVFTVEFLKLAMCKGSVPVPGDVCNCDSEIYSHKYYFEKWASRVRECLMDQLKALDSLDSVA